jgi:DNA-binding XRE family transcriptional regulator
LLKEERLEANLTQEELADKIGAKKLVKPMEEKEEKFGNLYGQQNIMVMT